MSESRLLACGHPQECLIQDAHGAEICGWCQASKLAARFEHRMQKAQAKADEMYRLAKHFYMTRLRDRRAELLRRRRRRRTGGTG